MPLATPVCGPHFKSFYEYRFPYYFKHVLLRTYFQIEKSYYITRVRTQHLQIKSQGSTRLIQLPGAAVSMNSSTIASSSKIIHIVYNMFFFNSFCPIVSADYSQLLCAVFAPIAYLSFGLGQSGTLSWLAGQLQIDYSGSSATTKIRSYLYLVFTRAYRQR